MIKLDLMFGLIGLWILWLCARHQVKQLAEARKARAKALQQDTAAILATRTEFITRYAERSGLSAKWAVLGFVKVEDSVLIALPCSCDDECEGWAMVAPDCIDNHLRLRAPELLRSAYVAAVTDRK